MSALSGNLIAYSSLDSSLPFTDSDMAMCINDADGTISWKKATKKLLLEDEITGEVYELIVSDGKLDIRATSKQGVRQQKIQEIVKDE